MRPHLSLLLAGTLILSGCQRAESPAANVAPPPVVPVDKPVRIPKVADASGDWAKQAHRIQLLSPIDNTPGSKVTLALAWTPTGLLLQAHTDDKTPFEIADPGELWSADSVGFGISSSFGSRDDLIGFVCSPGRTAQNPKPRWQVEDKRLNPPPLVPLEVGSVNGADGYTLTVLVPWSNFKHVPQAGDVIGVQVYVNDAQGNGPLAHRTWYPALGAGANQAERVQLAEQADPPEIATARLRPEGYTTFAFEVLALPEAAGKTVEIWSEGKQVASAQLAAGGFEGNSAAVVKLPPDLALKKDVPLQVVVDGRPLPTLFKVPDLTAIRLNALKTQPLVANSVIFSGAHFPAINFLNKELIAAALGPYTLETRFFDSQWNEVTVPDKPGRYGALIQIKDADGLTCERHVTLFKTPQPYSPTKDPYSVTVKFPAAFGFPPAVVNAEGWNISERGSDMFRNAARNDIDGAALAAAMSDIAADPAHKQGFSIWQIEDDWWAELDHRLGRNQDYKYLIRLPDDYAKEPNKKWPLLIFLHGSGERGSDLKAIETAGPLGYINKDHSLPCIVVQPQCPAGGWWVPSRLMALIDQICAANRVDPKRLYVTGLSMGGFGTFALAAEYPGKFAAIAPYAGGGNPGLAQHIGPVPAWIFHGGGDTVVATRYSVALADAMRRAGAPVKLTIFPGLDHGSWGLVYDNPELYAWLLQQHLK